MKKRMRLSLRIDNELLQKFYYIAEYESRPTDKKKTNILIERLIKEYVQEFEATHGEVNYNN